MRGKKLAKILPLIAAACMLSACGVKMSKTVKARQAKTTVTFFFHGFGSSINAEKHMAEAAKQAGKTNEILTATVKKNGEVKLRGKVADHPQNPVILVGFADNQNPDYHKDGWYAYQAVKAVQKQLGFSKMNLVGHSMGNMAISYMIMDDGQKKNFPAVKKQVAIAGHFNGIKGYSADSNSPLATSGKPKKMDVSYRDLLPLRRVYPKGAAVLNIYGDTGKGSDGRVYNNSSKSFKYLAAHAKSYQELLIKGKGAQHSRLHENSQVDKALQQFLWK
ncbi:alpha/beta hydrolase [Lactobacillus nasalidis]|uniref:Alpha/beta hydrolase n=1 Tax=Lactobacillus nasalidis TaxID=2797258 RepID=A0ABQ3W5M2_9LACO|nr:alpha/beta hydrolase [Lactobacillus nasalidis]GHW01850.1 alpha/beta hydrolase [Lactobacillus nasalidis]